MDSVRCRNCGNLGHKLKNCRSPRLSYGIILFNDKKEIVMIEKHDSISYIEFIRGKYATDNLNYIQLLIDRMSLPEKGKIIKLSFKELWNDIWYSEYNSREYDKSKLKYNIIKGNLKNCINNSSKEYEYNEWEIPKGRRNQNESNKECAIREFMEETNITDEYYDIYDNIIPFEEEYIGSNNIKYKNIYYLSYLKKEINLKIDKQNNEQLHEVKSIQWINKDNFKNYVRDYSDYKINILNNIFKFLDSDYYDKIII
jgi:8-oxo-dGTP pyrophosphatase MutT (NUDIX family)